MNDFILFTYLPGGMMGMSSSVDNVDARTHGAEAGLELRPAEHWKLGGTLAYAWGQNRSTGDALPQMPPLEARISIAFENPNWSFGMLVRAVSKQERISVDKGTVVGRDLSPSTGFATLSLNGGYHFNDHIQMTAGIDNIFDRLYSEHLNLAGSADFGYPADPVRINEPGRNTWLKLNLSF